MYQVLLQGICLQASNASLSYACILKSFCGTGEGSPVTADGFHQGSLAGYLYRHQLRGFHPVACMP